MKALNIVADENIEGVVQFLGDMGTVRLLNGREIQAADLQQADVLLVRSITPVDEGLLASSPVQFVGSATSGFDHVDREYLASRGISFAYAPGSNANSVVEYVLGAVASVGHKLEQLFEGATVGIIGYGNIGKLLARRLAALDIAYRVYDPWLDQSQVSNPASLQQVLCCDVISIHAELTRENPWPSFHLLGELELSSLSDDCLLINAGRGAVVDNIALEKRLRDRSGLKVVLDVWEGEPTVPESLLCEVHWGTAHIAGYSLDGKLLATQMLRDSLLSHLDSLAADGQGNDFPGAPVISVPERVSGAAFLRAMLLHNYDIGVDDCLMREAVEGQPPSVAAVNFDRLRKEYRVRREVYGSVVESSQVNPANMKITEAMACKLVERRKGAATHGRR